MERDVEDKSPPTASGGSDEQCATPPKPADERPPLQFSIKTLLGITFALALLLGTLRWLGVSPEAITIVMVILVASVIAALGLVIAIAYTIDDQ